METQKTSPQGCWECVRVGVWGWRWSVLSTMFFQWIHVFKTSENVLFEIIATIQDVDVRSGARKFKFVYVRRSTNIVWWDGDVHLCHILQEFIKCTFKVRVIHYLIFFLLFFLTFVSIYLNSLRKRAILQCISTGVLHLPLWRYDLFRLQRICVLF